MLTIKELKASIDDAQILKGLNLTIKPGEVHAIMGPNGSGKSTFARLIAGLATRSAGGLTVLGLDPCLGQDLVHRMAGCELENRRNLTLLGPCPHQFGPPAPAKDKAQSVKKDGFARAGLAGQHIQARLELESQPINYQQIADVEAPEHGSPKAWRGACLHHSHSPLTICR